jgi:hypothetical protein
MKGTPTQLTCRGALHGYPRISALTNRYALGQDVSQFIDLRKICWDRLFPAVTKIAIFEIDRGNTIIESDRA